MTVGDRKRAGGVEQIVHLWHFACDGGASLLPSVSPVDFVWFERNPDREPVDEPPPSWAEGAPHIGPTASMGLP